MGSRVKFRAQGVEFRHLGYIGRSCKEPSAQDSDLWAAGPCDFTGLSEVIGFKRYKVTGRW